MWGKHATRLDLGFDGGRKTAYPAPRPPYRDGRRQSPTSFRVLAHPATARAAYQEALFFAANALLGSNGERRKPLTSLKSGQRFAASIGSDIIRMLERWIALPKGALSVAGCRDEFERLADAHGLEGWTSGHFFAAPGDPSNKTTDAVFGSDRKTAMRWHSLLRRLHKHNRKLLAITKSERRAEADRWLARFGKKNASQCATARGTTTPLAGWAQDERTGTLYRRDSMTRIEKHRRYIETGHFNYDKRRSHWSNACDMFGDMLPMLVALYDHPDGATELAKAWVTRRCINGGGHRTMREAGFDDLEVEHFEVRWAKALVECRNLDKAMREQGTTLQLQCLERDAAVVRWLANRGPRNGYRVISPEIDGVITEGRMPQSVLDECKVIFGPRSGDVREKDILKPWERAEYDRIRRAA